MADTKRKASGPRLSSDGTALHRQVFLLLRERIGRRQYAPGACLPTEEELCHQFGVSRVTVRRALQDLDAEGLVERRHGRGTYVREHEGVDASAPPLTGIERLQERVALVTRVEVIEAGTRPAPAAIAEIFGIPCGADAVYALRVRRAGEVVLMVTEAWLPEHFAEIASPTALRKQALSDLLFRAGVSPGRIVQELSAEAADPLIARLLETAIGTPLIRLTRVLHDETGVPVQHLTVRLTPERSRVLMDIPAHSVDTLSAGYVSHDVLPALRTTLAHERGERRTPIKPPRRTRVMRDSG